MRHTQHHLRSAPIAIAAILALGTTPAIAQTAPTQTAPAPSASDPIVLQSPIAPPTAAPRPAPTTAAPVVAPRTTQPTPQQPPIVLDIPPAPVAETPEPGPAANQRSTAAAAEPRRTTRERAAPERPAARDTAPAAAVTTAAPDTPVSSTDDSTLLADDAVAPLPVAEPAPEALATETAPAAGPDWVAIIALALAGLIPLGAIFLAMAWFRRRSRRVEAVEAHEDAAYIEESVIEPEPAPVAAPVVREPARAPQAAVPSLTFAREPVPVGTTVSDAPKAPARRHPMDGYKGLPNAGAAVSLPAELPESFEERDALLKRMIAAEPDRANPFRSGKARAKRARLILQSLGRTFENVKPRIDLSQYTRNWPALAGGRRTSFA